MSSQLAYTVTPLTLHPLLRRRPFAFKVTDEQTEILRNSMRCQMELVLDGLCSMSRSAKTEAYAHLSSVLTQNAWLPRDTELYRYMQHGFGVMFEFWQSELPDLSDVADELAFIFIALGRCQFASGLYDRLRPDLLNRLANYDDSDALRAKCATALVLGGMIAENPTVEYRHCESLLRAAFDQQLGIEARIHVLRMAALYMAHLDLRQMELLARTDCLDNLLHLLETQQELQHSASTCLVLMLKQLNSPAALQVITKQLEQLAKHIRPIRHNFKFLTVESRVEAIEKFPEIGEQIKLDSIKKRLTYETFKSVLQEDFVLFLEQCEKSFVRQTMKPSSMMAKREKKKNFLMRAIRRVF